MATLKLKSELTSSLTGLCISCPTVPNYFSILNCTFAQLIVYSSIFIASSVLRKMITSISWTALNGTECDQQRLSGNGAGNMLVEEGPLVVIVE